MRWDTLIGFYPCCMGSLTNELPGVNVEIDNLFFLSVYAFICYYTIHGSSFYGYAVLVVFICLPAQNGNRGIIIIL